MRCEVCQCNLLMVVHVSLYLCMSVTVCDSLLYVMLWSPGPTLVRTGAGWRLNTALGCSVVTPQSSVANTQDTRHHVVTVTL